MSATATTSLADEVRHLEAQPLGRAAADPVAPRVDEALRETTAAGWASATDLMALVTAPPPSLAATIHRVEVLRLQPTSGWWRSPSPRPGGVAKRVFDFDEPVDPGIEWASSYLNELCGMGVGSRMIADRLLRDELDPVEAEFIGALGRWAETDAGTPFYVDGASRLFSEAHLDDLPRADELMTALERRAACSGCCARRSMGASVFLWIGDENPQPELRSVSVVGANFGLAHRNLGSVGVVGPLRMDYATAISSVRSAARELSRYCEMVFEG